MTWDGNRASVLMEAYPGATNEIERAVDAAGGWVCEEHPDREWPHDDCPGPGMPKRPAEVPAP